MIIKFIFKFDLRKKQNIIEYKLAYAETRQIKQRRYTVRNSNISEKINLFSYVFIFI